MKEQKQRKRQPKKKQKPNTVQVYNLQNLMVKTSFQVKRKKMKLAIVLTLLQCLLLFVFSY